MLSFIRRYLLLIGAVQRSSPCATVAARTLLPRTTEVLSCSRNTRLV